MKRTLTIEVYATSVFGVEENTEYENATPMQRMAFAMEMRANIEKWFADNMDNGSEVNVNVTIEEESQ